MRTADSDTFESASGVYVARVYTSAINYRAADGSWRPIDSRFVSSGGKVVNRADALRLSLPARLGKGAVSVSEGGYAVSFRLQGARSVKGLVCGRVVRYVNAFPGVTVSYASGAGAIDLAFRISSPRVARSFRIILGLSGGLRAELRGTAVLIVDASGRTRFTIPAPMMYAAGRQASRSGPVAVSLTDSRRGWLLAYTPSRSWLTVPGRHFPVVLDPQVNSEPPKNVPSTGDCTIYSGDPSNAAYCQNQQVYDVVGNPSHTSYSYRTLMNFPSLECGAGSSCDPAEIPADSEVLGATLSLSVQQLSGNEVGYQVVPISDTFASNQGSWTYSNTSTSTKWSCAGGDYDGCPGTPSMIAATGTFNQNGSTTVALTALVQSWVDGSSGVSQPALMLNPTTTGGTASIYRVEGTNTPSLSIYYVPRLGNDSGSTILNTKLNSSTSLGVNVANGDVQLASQDLHVSGTAGMDLSLGRSYDSLSPNDGWSIAQPPSLASVAGDSVAHTQPDGNVSVWNAVQDQNGAPTNVYTPPPGFLGSLCHVSQNPTPAVLRDSTSGDQWIYYVGANQQLYGAAYNGSAWTTPAVVVAGAEPVAANSSPSVFRDPASGDVWIYYVGANGQIYTDAYDGSWGNDVVVAGAEPVAANTSPTAFRDPTSGDQWVYYAGANGQLYYDSYDGSWGNAVVVAGGEPVDPGTSPSAFRDQTVSGPSADQWVYYTGANGQLYYDSYDGSWGNAAVVAGGEPVDPGTSPSAFRDQTVSGPSADQWVYYTGANGQLYSDTYAGSWTNANPGLGETAPADAACSPAAAGTYSATTDPVWELTDFTSGERWDFNAGGQLVADIDKNGNQIDYQYNMSGSVAKITDTQGRTMTYSYGSTGSISGITDSTLNRNITYGWNSAGQLASYTDANDNTTHYSYNASKLLSQITDPDGEVTNIGYGTDGAGLLQLTITRVTNNQSGTGDPTTYAYYGPSPAGYPSCGTDPSGGAPPYGATVVTTAVSSTSSRWSEYCYDTHDRVYQVIDEYGNRTTTTYDSNDDVTEIADPVGGTTNLFDPCFRPTSQSSGVSGSPPTYTETYAGGTSGNTCTATSPLQYLQTSSSSPESTSNTPTTIDYVHDGNGNLKQETDGLPHGENTLSFTYNAQGEMTSSTDATGSTTTYCYSSNPGNNCATSYGNLISVSAPAPLQVRSYKYDGDSRIVSSSDGDGNTTAFTYDADDEVVGDAYQSGATTTNTYDADGNMTKAVDSESGTTTYSYDLKNRLTSETDPGAGGQPLTTTTYGYDEADDLASLTDGGGAVAYSYDDDGRATSVQEPNTSSPIALGYDVDGRLICSIYPTGVVVQRSYDSYDDLLSVQAANGSGAACQPSSPSGTPTGNVFTSDAYTYSGGAGNSDLRESEDANGTTWYYYYDALNRLIEATTGFGQTYNYSYDGDGNLMTRTINPASGAAETAAYNAADEICWTYAGTVSNPACSSPTSGDNAAAYDGAGNRTNLASQAGTTTLGYNAREQTTSVNPFGGGAQTLSYRGNGQGNPVQIGNQPSGGEAPALEENTLGVSAEEAAVPQGGSPSITYYTRAPDGTLLGERTSTGNYYYIEDANGSIIAITDSAGNVANTYTYDPYGAAASETGSAPNIFGFDGGYNAQGGLILFGQRYYDPATGSWTQPDPGLEVTSPTSSDRYAFADDDPVNKTDLTGEGPTQGNYTLGQQTIAQCVRWQHGNRHDPHNPYYYDQWTYHNCQWWYRWMRNFLKSTGYSTPWKWYCLGATAVISAPTTVLSAAASWLLGIAGGIGCTSFT